jgi:hypothetical protein
MMVRLSRNLITLSITFALAACGGGGGGSSSSTTVVSTLTFPFAQAFADFVANSHSFNYSMSGNDAGTSATGSGTVYYGAAVGATFEGQSGLSQTAVISGTTTENNQTTPYSATVDSFYTTNYVPLGSSSATDYCVVQGTPVLPTGVKVGDAADLYVEDCYVDSSKTTKTSQDTNSYSISADTASTAIVDLITRSRSPLSGAVMSSDEDRYRIDQNGNFTWISETYTDYTTTPPSSLTFTAQ